MILSIFNCRFAGWLIGCVLFISASSSTIIVSAEPLIIFFEIVTSSSIYFALIMAFSSITNVCFAE